MPATAAVTASNGEPSPRSLLDKLLNIFVSPGEVFEEVIASPHRAVHWRLPVLLNCLAAIVLFLAVTGPAPSPQPSDGERQSPPVSSAATNPPAAALPSFGASGDFAG